ncbi:MAG: hypothetical protein KME26_27500 [Oscillatoria princeps RMCB-10]|jgi:hypothetical protein|nr:hypothetical protein [Oscillatoria princeps RMCB-10]
MRGVQFFTDCQGKKTAALVDLKEHSAFWADVLEEYGERNEFQFLIDEGGQKIAVLLDFENYGDLWEDVYDALMTENLEDEPGIPLEEFQQELMKEKGMLNV